MLSAFIQCVSNVTKVIFPTYCASCKCPTEDLVCSGCYHNITFIDNGCVRCGYQLNYETTDNLCANCVRNPPLFSSAQSVMIYNEHSQNIIWKFKFNDGIHIANSLGELLLAKTENILQKIDLIMPVPLHRWKLLARGYNQSSILANFIARKTNIKIDHLSLYRTKNTKAQTQISTPLKRSKNMSNAFAVRNNSNIHNKNIVLIDDVITTGATIHNCTRVLLKHGAQSVHILSLARSPKPLLLN